MPPTNVVVIAGASSGIGKATAELVTARGGAVVIAARRSAEIESLAATLGANALAVTADATRPDDAEALVDAAVGRFGRIDAVVVCTGTLGALGPVTELSPEDWQAVIDTNLTSVWLLARAAMPHLATSAGAFASVSSFIGPNASFPGTSPYSAAKAGLIGLTKALAVEWGSSNVRVNTLVAGAVDTPMFRSSFGATDESAAGVAKLHALGRVASAEEIAEAISFVISPAASFITGAAIPVDGGVTAGR